MPRLDEVFSPTSPPRPEAPPTVLVAGLVLEDAAGGDDRVRVRTADDEVVGPCPWLPRGGGFPEAGDSCLVALSSDGEDWIVNWDGEYVDPAGSVAADLADAEAAIGELEDDLSDLTTSLAVEAFTAVTFQNSWVDYPSYSGRCSYMKDPFGFVHLRGLINKGTAALVLAQTMFTLPAGYRPTLTEHFVVKDQGTILSRVDVSPTGTVQLIVGTVGAADGSNTNKYVSLAGLTFKGEQ